MAGKVYSGERKLEKPGHKLNPDTPLRLREAPHPWVSRGGIKLASAGNTVRLAKSAMNIPLPAMTPSSASPT